METKSHSVKFLRKRKLFLVLPVIALPFLTLLFWALGGGKGSDAIVNQQTGSGGLNLELPNAYLEDQMPLDKLSYYEKAATDSAKLKDLMENDPTYWEVKGIDTAESMLSTRGQSLPIYQPHSSGNSKLTSSSYGSYADANEAKVYKKLDELNDALSKANVEPGKSPLHANASGPSIENKDVDRLEQMMNMAGNQEGSEDPEIDQLSRMMDKILDIQHPERVKEKLGQNSEVRKNQVFAVTRIKGNVTASLLFNDDSIKKKQAASRIGFYSLGTTAENRDEQNSIRAAIYETQTLVDGSIVKLRLLDDIYVNGELVPKGSFLFGTGSVEGERLHILINSIRYKSSLFPVQLVVHDLDGLNGIHIPGAITREVAKQSADRTIQGIGLATLDPSLGAQAASAGIEAAKTLLSRKAKLVKFTLKPGYQVLLQDEKQKTSL